MRLSWLLEIPGNARRPMLVHATQRVLARPMHGRLQERQRRPEQGGQNNLDILVGAFNVQCVLLLLKSSRFGSEARANPSDIKNTTPMLHASHSAVLWL